MAGKRHKIHKVATKTKGHRKLAIHGGFKAMEHKVAATKRAVGRALAGSVDRLGHTATTDAAGGSPTGASWRCARWSADGPTDAAFASHR